MSLIRKLIVVLVGVSLALLITILLINPQAFIQLAENMAETSLLIRLPLVILLDAIVIVVLVAVVRGSRRTRSSEGLVVKARGAVADISVASARERMLRAVRAVPDVIDAEADLKAVRGKADIDLDVVISRASANLPEKQREIDRALRQVVQKELGLQMEGKPRVHIRMDNVPIEEAPPTLPPVAVDVGAAVTKTEVETETVVEPEIRGEEPLKVETIRFDEALNDAPPEPVIEAERSDEDTPPKLPTLP